MTESSDAEQSGPGPSGPEDPTPAGPSDPTPETPEQAVPNQDIPSPAENYSNADPALQTWFWKVVLLLKLSIIGVTLGSLLLYFRADFDRGGPLLAGGLVLFAYTVREARQLKARADAGEFEHDTADDSSDDSTVGEPAPTEDTR